MNKESYEILIKAVQRLEKQREKLDWVANHDHLQDFIESIQKRAESAKKGDLEQAVQHNEAAKKAMSYCNQQMKSREKLFALNRQISQIQADINMYRYFNKEVKAAHGEETTP